MFGIKDIFTTINLMGGVVGISLCIDGRPFAAGVAVLLGYAFGDTLDGWVARKLNSANVFGAEYDTISDHTSHVIAPAAIVYTVYRDAGLLASPYDQILAIFLAGSLVTAASVRHARNIVSSVSYEGVWAGLPRSVLGFIPICYVNAALAPHLLGGYWIGVVLIPLLSLSTLTRLPFPNHKMIRSHYRHVKILIASAFILPTAAAVVRPEFVFDIMFFFIFGYALTGWMALTKAERKEYFAAVRATRAAEKAGAQ